eukprot:COSAG03_NODE_6567_length_1039_cov_1.690426_1_plen_54_part_10
MKPVGLTRDGLSYMPRLAAAARKHAETSGGSADGEWWHRFYHGPLLETLALFGA